MTRTAAPYRLPHAAGLGRLIDRDRPLGFTFDGQRLSGYAGDTLASALLANGRRLVGRSFKYHRPRGIVGLGTEEMNALVGVGLGADHEPNLQATRVELRDRLVAVSQNRWPSLSFDIGQINDVFSRFIPGGFYYKTFKWPKSFWHHLYEPLIRRAAGLGRAPSGRDSSAYEQIRVDCDVLVVGGGPSGLAAAQAAAASGARVMLAEDQPSLGGVGDLYDASHEFRAPPDVMVLTRTTALAHFHHNYLLLAERCLGEGPRQRLWKVRAKEVILATGAIERPIAFANNDRPGVMMAEAARGYLARFAVAPGERGVVFTNNDEAYRTALLIGRAGAGEVTVVDIRKHPEGALVEEARRAGIPILAGTVVSQVESTAAGQAIEAVRIAAFRPGMSRLLRESRLPCDYVAVSGGYNPAVHLWCHNGGKLRYDMAIHAYRPDRHRDRMWAVGAANGTFDLESALAESRFAGEQAAARALARPMASDMVAPQLKPRRQGAIEPIWFAPASRHYNDGHKHFVDFQNDVTVADLELAQREGYSSVEHTKRYTTWGMASDQGKTSSVLGLGILSEATGRPIPEIGVTTFRPPFTPLTFGTVAGAQKGPLFLAVRQTPVHDWHVANGATFEPVGHWRRAYCYPSGGEDKAAAIAREILSVRRAVGLLDASTLGKIEIRGRDAGAFLDRIYTNSFSTLKVGRCRYGLMLNELGFIIDDGVTARLADDHFLMHTTSGGADRIAAWLEEWLQTEWPDLRVLITPVTEQWAQFAVAGPKARTVLEALAATGESDIDVTAGSFPFMSWRAGRLGGFRVRIFRISFSGELSFEIATPARDGLRLWEALMTAGAPLGITAYGTEALHVLRAEKGYIVVGDETDGTVTPRDVGLDGLVSKTKRDFIGRRSLEQSFLRAEGRKELVGLLTEDPREVLPDGAHAVREVKANGPMATIGHVTSSYMSPTLERSIAMALIENGRSRMGETLTFPLEGGRLVKATIVSPVFYDPQGERQNV
jgi:sarcosine oxidase, subunit alpha